MTKQEFIKRWRPTHMLISDLEALIANEIEKVQEEKTNKIEITPHTLVEVNRAFRALKQDRNSYIHKVFSDDGVFDAMEEIRKMFDNYFVEQPQEAKPALNSIGEPYETFGTLGYKKPQHALNPIAEAYEHGEKIRHKRWIKGEWLSHSTKTDSSVCFGRWWRDGNFKI